VDLHVLVDQPTLVGELVRLEPMGPEHLEGLWPMFLAGEDEASPFAGFTREQVRAGLTRAKDQHNRADWVIVRRSDDRVLGEVVLFALDEDAEAMEFRIALVGPDVIGHGYGTDATQLVSDLAFGPLGLHRLSLEVIEDNVAARRVYEKVGFVVEGVRRQARRAGTGWVDLVDMAMLATDPRPAPRSRAVGGRRAETLR
jgi:RimJ/RimL family protein N-acetyltransferase